MITKLNTIKEYNDYITKKFTTDQSTIVQIDDLNMSMRHGVNVIVKTPTVGDILCVTRYTDESGVILGPDKQEIVWVKGLTFNGAEFTTELDPVGICFAVYGKKAYVRYKHEYGSRWSYCDRFEISQESIMTDGTAHNAVVTMSLRDNSKNTTSTELGIPDFTWTATSVYSFYTQLKAWMIANLCVSGTSTAEKNLFSVSYEERAHEGVDASAKGEAAEDPMVIVNCYFNKDGWKTFNIAGFTSTRCIYRSQKDNYSYPQVNGFNTGWCGGCCRSKYYDAAASNQYGTPTSTCVNVHAAPGIKTPWGDAGGATNGWPVNKTAFEGSEYCQLLRDTYATYDAYIDSKMAKIPTGRGNTGTNYNNGKDLTYALKDAKYPNPNLGLNSSGDWTWEPVYCTNKAITVSENCKGLTSGNWWLPSTGEMCILMKDVTYGTNSWSSNPDIVNRVITKLRVTYGGAFDYLSASASHWTSARCYSNCAYYYYGNGGFLDYLGFYYSFTVAPISLVTLA